MRRFIGVRSRSSAPKPSLNQFDAPDERVAVRIIHASGMVDVADDIFFTQGFSVAASTALRAGAPVFCDSQMVAHGITRARLPADNAVICTLSDPRVPALASSIGNTRSAAALELWRERLAGSVVVIGNAPTALFRLLEICRSPARRDPQPSSACPSALSAQPSPRRRYWQVTSSPASSFAEGAAAAQWLQRPSTRSRVNANEFARDHLRCRSGARRPRADEREGRHG